MGAGVSGKVVSVANVIEKAEGAEVKTHGPAVYEVGSFGEVSERQLQKMKKAGNPKNTVSLNHSCIEAPNVEGVQRAERDDGVGKITRGGIARVGKQRWFITEDEVRARMPDPRWEFTAEVVSGAVTIVSDDEPNDVAHVEPDITEGALRAGLGSGAGSRAARLSDLIMQIEGVGAVLGSSHVIVVKCRRGRTRARWERKRQVRWVQEGLSGLDRVRGSIMVGHVARNCG